MLNRVYEKSDKPRNELVSDLVNNTQMNVTHSLLLFKFTQNLVRVENTRTNRKSTKEINLRKYLPPTRRPITTSFKHKLLRNIIFIIGYRYMGKWVGLGVGKVGNFLNMITVTTHYQ